MIRRRTQHNKTNQKQKGFTLIELVVAMAIFSLIGIGTYSLFDMVFRLKEKTDAASAKLASVQKAMVILQNDVEQMTRRNTRDVFGDARAALVGAENGVEFTRVGWNISPFSKTKRSSMQRVRYQVEEEGLIRSYWTMLDQPDQAEPKSNVLLEDVEELNMRYLDRDSSLGDTWHETWPPLSNSFSGGAGSSNTADSKLPVIVEMKLKHKSYGEIRRVFLIAAGRNLPETQSPVTAGDPDPNDPNNPTNPNDPNKE